MNINQLKSKIRQNQQKRKRAIDDYNRAVRKHNQDVRQQRQKFNTAVNAYNHEVRKHNSRVRANQARLNTEISRLRSRQNVHFTQVSSSAMRVSSAYHVLDSSESSIVKTRNGAEFLDLSEKQAADAVAVANRLETEENEAMAGSVDSLISDELSKLSSDWDSRWKGALYALSPNNPDAGRHFCSGTREILVNMLDQFAPDRDVKSTLQNVEFTPHGAVTRKSKIRYILLKRGIFAASAIEFVDEDMGDVLTLFGVFNSGTHGKAGKFSQSQLHALKTRTENAILYLCRICEMS